MKPIFFLLVFLFSVNLHADDVPAVSSGKIQFYVDWASFKGNNDKIYQEFYLMVFADQLKFVQENSTQKKASLNTIVIIKDLQNNIISRKDWITETKLPSDTIGKTDLVVYDQFSESFLPGEYNISVSVNDENSSLTGIAEFKINIEEFPDSELSASQIEFVSSIEEKSGNPNFKKGSNAVIPNPARRYGILNPLLQFYYEIYNLPQTNSENLTVVYSLTNKDGRIIKTLPEIKIKKPGKSAVVIHGFDVSIIPTGIYNLLVNISDKEINEKLTFSRNFEIIQADYVSIEPGFTKEDAELAGRLIKIFNPEKFTFYEKMNLQAKAAFLIKFWKEYDPSPGTIENEFLQRIQQRYHYANQKFSWGKKEGWESERGQILIKYGNPDNIESHHSVAGAVPYEKWIYQMDRRYEFIFADLNMNGQFVLLHSTKEGEVQNQNWKDYIKK